MMINSSGAATAMPWDRQGDGVNTILQQAFRVAAIRRR
jgi:hypothetical protein